MSIGSASGTPHDNRGPADGQALRQPGGRGGGNLPAAGTKPEAKKTTQEAARWRAMRARSGEDGRSAGPARTARDRAVTPARPPRRRGSGWACPAAGAGDTRPRSDGWSVRRRRERRPRASAARGAGCARSRRRACRGRSPLALRQHHEGQEDGFGVLDGRDHLGHASTQIRVAVGVDGEPHRQRRLSVRCWLSMALSNSASSTQLPATSPRSRCRTPASPSPAARSSASTATLLRLLPSALALRRRAWSTRCPPAGPPACPWPAGETCRRPSPG